MYDYKLDFEVGRRAELAFQAWLTRNFPNLKTWLAPDNVAETFDIRLYGNGKQLRFEIKFDRKMEETKNLLVELYSETAEGQRKNGWFLTSTAHVWVYFFNEYQFIAFPSKAVRDFFYTEPGWWVKKEIEQHNGTKTINWVTPNWSMIQHYVGDVRE